MKGLGAHPGTFWVAARRRRRTRPIAEPRSGVRVLQSDGDVQAAIARAVEFERIARDGSLVVSTDTPRRSRLLRRRQCFTFDSETMPTPLRCAGAPKTCSLPPPSAGLRWAGSARLIRRDVSVRAIVVSAFGCMHNASRRTHVIPRSS